ncbi:MAG: hypothetical protein MRY59_14045 [Aquisalinus sp.]|nr:hypothetical protein [Aquisalinus sp.]
MLRPAMTKLLTSACATLLLLAACAEKGDETAHKDGHDGAHKAADYAGVMELKGLKTPASFSSMTDDTERAAAIFTEMSKVLLHPRCSNCHPRYGGPTQGDNMEPHEPPMVRGAGLGPDAMGCDTCHGKENVAYASMEGSVPGAEPWLLAPESMGWAGATPAELCVQIKDENLNGGRSLEDLIEHNTVDHLVNWAWNPGEGRTPAPGEQALFGALTSAWVEAGAHCPA